MELDKESLNHARALRVREGEEVELLDGCGTVWKGTFGKEGVRISSVREKDRQTPEIILCVGITQGGSFDDVVRQAVQMGVSEVCPLITQRVAINFENKRLNNKMERWGKIAEEGCKQSGLAWLPKIKRPTRFAEAVSAYGRDRNIVASLYGAITPWKELKLGGVHRIVLWIGPEGDFSKDEYEALLAKGAEFVGLGDAVLRVETACVAVLASLRAILS